MFTLISKTWITPIFQGLIAVRHANRPRPAAGRGLKVYDKPLLINKKRNVWGTAMRSAAYHQYPPHQSGGSLRSPIK